MKIITKAKICTFIIVLLVFFYSLFEVNWVQIVNHDLKNPKITKDFDNFKIVFISDIHRNWCFSNKQIENAVKKVNSLNPNLVILGGDYIDAGTEYVEPSISELAKIKAKYWVYAVLGNHDYWWNIELTKKILKQNNIKLLANSNEKIKIWNSKIFISGIVDIREDSPDITKAFSWITKDDFNIFVSHNPDFAENISDSRYDFMLSWHTHGWQITLFWLWAWSRLPSGYGNKYRTWIIKTKYAELWVSNWIWPNALPFRFFARPQINLLTLKAN